MRCERYSWSGNKFEGKNLKIYQPHILPPCPYIHTYVLILIVIANISVTYSTTLFSWDNQSI